MPENSLESLVGIFLIFLGFLARLNIVLTALCSGIITAAISHIPLVNIIGKIGEYFLITRNLPFIFLIPLLVISLLEKHSLTEYAKIWIAKISTATAGRLLMIYFFIRQLSAGLGLTGIGGHPQLVCPLLAPMSEEATLRKYNMVSLPYRVRHRLRCMAAATENIGLFFGEDIFVAFGAILFAHNFILKSSGIQTNPIHIAFWSFPTAFFSFLVHSIRLRKLDADLAKILGGTK